MLHIEQRSMTEKDVQELFLIEENHFNDFKAKDISGEKLSRTLSAFANASGGDIYLGIREETNTKQKHWEGFASVEDANAFVQVISDVLASDSNYSLVFLKHPLLNTYVLQVTVFKTQSIIKTTGGKSVYVRKNAQNLPYNTPERIRELELDKGIATYEDEIVSGSSIDDVIDSKIFNTFCEHIVPSVDQEQWLKKQKLCRNGQMTVAGLLLFSDEPQASLPKRSSVKVFRYRTTAQASRETLVNDPLTIEGCAYTQIFDSVKTAKEILESIRKLGKDFESIVYPEETIHEIITNAVLHRDYSITTDIQVRIFDNRVEIESPGKLPGHVTTTNILDSQSARNPRLVRLINKFPDAPNKDVGEGLNTAFEAMAKLRLKTPIIMENDKSVLVIIKHERLASPEDIVMQYLDNHGEITNRVGRSLTGIPSENTMKQVFWRLRDRNMLEMVPGKKGAASAWRRKQATRPL